MSYKHSWLVVFSIFDLSAYLLFVCWSCFHTLSVIDQGQDRLTNQETQKSMCLIIACLNAKSVYLESRK